MSRCSVTVVLFDSRSTSPDCTAVKRCCEVSGTYLTFSASPKMAAATARQTSTFSPVHLPWLSASMKPAVPVPTPQMTAPRALIASRSLPASALPEIKNAASPMAVGSVAVRMVPPVVVMSGFPERVFRFRKLASRGPNENRRLWCAAVSPLGRSADAGSDLGPRSGVRRWARTGSGSIRPGRRGGGRDPSRHACAPRRCGLPAATGGTRPGTGHGGGRCPARR